LGSSGANPMPLVTTEKERARDVNSRSCSGLAVRIDAAVRGAKTANLTVKYGTGGLGESCGTQNRDGIKKVFVNCVKQKEYWGFEGQAGHCGRAK